MRSLSAASRRRAASRAAASRASGSVNRFALSSVKRCFQYAAASVGSAGMAEEYMNAQREKWEALQAKLNGVTPGTADAEAAE